VRGRWHYAPLLLSRTGRLLAREKYSAFAIDRVYADIPDGWGWIGRRLDRYLLDLPVHRAARARLDFVVRRGTDVLARLLAARAGRVGVLSVPCGLIRDLCLIHEQLRRREGSLVDRLLLHGLDLDHEGHVLDEARRRAARAGVPVQVRQGDALDPGAWAWLARSEAPLLLVSCIGLAPWLDPAELRGLLGQVGVHLTPGGYLLIDRWNRGRHARWARDTEIPVTYHTDGEYREHFRAVGLVPLECEALGEGEGMVYLVTTAARPASGPGGPASTGRTPAPAGRSAPAG
jgi:SAM-dependent methyltransferase